MVILAIDPGCSKCGLAVVDETLCVRARQVVETPTLSGRVGELIAAHPITHLVIGDRTGSRQVAGPLRGVAGDRPIVFVDEHLTSLEARHRYFRENPPRGWRRLVPLGLQTPPCPIDDYAAVLLAERYLRQKERQP